MVDFNKVLENKRKLSLINSGLLCPYCDIESKLIDSTDIYGSGHDYGKMYQCPQCKAYVGCHKNSTKALGRLANEELRYWKKQTHFFFDQLWKQKGIPRTAAYAWLSQIMKKPIEETHIGMFTQQECIDAIQYTIATLELLKWKENPMS